MEYYMDEKWKVSKEEKSKAAAADMSTGGSNKKKPFNLARSFSHQGGSGGSAGRAPAPSGLHRSSSQRCSEFTRMAKEQKAKFYIVKRCISMLVAWKKHGGSDS